MKTYEIILRRGGKRENDGEGKSKIYCKHICKYHNISCPCNYYMLIKFLQKEKKLL
jgi:hypothetical protein